MATMVIILENNQMWLSIPTGVCGPKGIKKTQKREEKNTNGHCVVDNSRETMSVR